MKYHQMFKNVVFLYVCSILYVTWWFVLCRKWCGTVGGKRDLFSSSWMKWISQRRWKMCEQQQRSMCVICLVLTQAHFENRNEYVDDEITGNAREWKRNLLNLLLQWGSRQTEATEWKNTLTYRHGFVSTCSVYVFHAIEVIFYFFSWFCHQVVFVFFFQHHFMLINVKSIVYANMNGLPCIWTTSDAILWERERGGGRGRWADWGYFFLDSLSFIFFFVLSHVQINKALRNL